MTAEDEDEQREPLVKGTEKSYGVKEGKTRHDSISSYGSTQDEGDKKSKKKKKKKKSVPIRTLFRYATWLDIFLMIVGSFFSFVHGAGWPVLAIIFGNMTNTFVGQVQEGFVSATNGTSILRATAWQEDTEMDESLSREVFQTQMNTFALYYVYIGAVVFVAASMEILCWTMSCERQVYCLRQEFLYQVLRQEIAWFDRHQSGELSVKLNEYEYLSTEHNSCFIALLLYFSDIERIREGIGDKFGMLIQYTSTFIAGFLVGFYKGWELTLVIMALTPLVALTSAFMGKMVATSSAREQAKYAIAGGVAEEVLGCIRTVTSFCGQKREIKRYTDALKMGKDVAIKKYYFMAMALGFTFLILYGTYSLAFWYGSELILANKMDAGNVFTVFFAVMIGSFSLGNAAPHLATIAQAQGSALTIFQILDRKPRIDAYSEKGVIMDQLKANIEFRNVSFNYPTRKAVQVLRNLTLLIKEGQTVALCGASGCGKSTVVSLLLRFYDTAAGHISLNGYSLRDLNVRWLRTIIGVVSQEPVLFGCSIEENIRYGRNDVTFLEICDAARMANAHEFIVALPSGYDTLVGDRGAQLSGGQKQRIAIARALVRDPKILLLDEATSALDAESEAVVQLALDKAREGRTTIVIAHRLSTIRNADVIYAMENGSVLEQGTHDELMDKEGLYYQLVMNQMFTDETGYSTSEQGGEMSDTVLKKIKDQAVRRRSSVKGNSYYYDKDPNVQRLAVEAETEDVDIPSGWRIMRAAGPECKPIFLACIASLFTGATMPIFAIFYGEIFNTFTLVGDDLKKAAFFWSMMFLVLAVCTALGNYFRTLGFAYSGENLTMRLRREAFTNVLRQDIGWFDEEIHSSGKIATRLASDVPIIKGAAGHRLGVMVSAVVTLGTSLILAFIFGWQLALALTASVPILLAVGGIEMKVMKGNQIRDAELMADAGRVVTESLENIRTVQSITQEPLFLEKYLNHLLLPYMENKKNSMVYALAFAFSQGIIFLIYAAAFWFGSYLIANQKMEAVNVYRVFFAMAFSAVSVGQWTSYLPDYTKAKLSAGLVFKMIEEQPNIDSYFEGGVRPVLRGEVTFSDVHFHYPSRTRAPVLQNLNLSIKSGQTVALIGPSGCGKSTLVSLLQRFYDPHMGQVKVDDFDIRTVNLQHLRSHMAVVSQEPVLFNCSIRDNIMYGLEGEVTQFKIEQAARTANIHDFISALPMGYDTMVGERGAQLSGGQKQRIAIARALVRDPKILLLDEATSALDTESEKLVQEALDQARQGRTCIVIAHRLSTVQNADYIAVMDKGRVAEMGTHEQLLAKKGIYYKLTKKQRIR